MTLYPVISILNVSQVIFFHICGVLHEKHLETDHFCYLCSVFVSPPAAGQVCSRQGGVVELAAGGAEEVGRPEKSDSPDCPDPGALTSGGQGEPALHPGGLPCHQTAEQWVIHTVGSGGEQRETAVAPWRILLFGRPSPRFRPPFSLPPPSRVRLSHSGAMITGHSLWVGGWRWKGGEQSTCVFLS